MSPVLRLLHSWWFVLAVCEGVNELLPLLLDSMDAFPPQYRGHIAHGIAVAGVAARVVRGIAMRAQAEEAKAKEQALAASADKAASAPAAGGPP